MHLAKWHIWSVLAGYFVCAAAVLVVTQCTLLQASGAALGPFAGAISRGWQECCAQWSWVLLPFGAAPLIGGIVVQRLVAPTSRGARRTRAIVWSLGSGAWFVCGFLSLGHALS